MYRTLRTALLATTLVASAHTSAFAGSDNSYANPTAQQGTSVTTFTAAAPPVMETYTVPAPVVTETVKDGFYDSARYGGNDSFGYKQSAACGGVLDGEHCLVILSDHMRRVRLERPAGTILVGNPLIADVTVLGNDTLFVSARTIGSTNVIVLDKKGNEIVTYEVFVREPRSKRVTLNNAGIVQTFQCAPHCEAALTQSDSASTYGARSGIISTDLGLDQQAIGLQSGPNPNTEPSAPTPAQGGGIGAGASAAPAPTGRGASSASEAALTGSIAGLAGSVAPAINTLEGITGLLGGIGGGAPAPSAPVRSDAPPLPSGLLN